MDQLSKDVLEKFTWNEALGWGHYPVAHDRPYDADYFEKYRVMADTSMGRELTRFRNNLVARHFGDGQVLDVGIGSGQFVESRPGALGFDVNPAGVEWLKSRSVWSDLYAKKYPALTFWDSLEHIDDPAAAIAMAEEWVFVSVPIFSSKSHALNSRHFKPEEHIWYWTHEGLIRWFDSQGFGLKEVNDAESQLGRDGIGSYAFKRRKD